MDFDDYQVQARKTAIYPNLGNNISYPTLGLVGEAGEVANTVKKIFRDNAGMLTASTRHNIIFELGDVLWYIANLAAEIGIPLDEIAQHNLAKLKARQENNTLHGSGDR